MYHRLWKLLAAVALLAACGQPAAQPTAVPVTLAVEPITPTPEIFMPVPDEVRAEVSAREALAQHLGVDMAVIVVRKSVATNWPDSCLGLTFRDQACRIGEVAGFRVVLDIDEATYEVRTDQRSETVLVAGRVDPTLGELPAVCQGIGQATFYSPENGFCFAYPASFTLGETNPTHSELFGPPLDDSPNALRAALLVEVQPVTTDADLAALVEAYLAGVDPQLAPTIERAPLTLGGEPAERLEGVSGQAGTRDVFMLRDSVLFHLTFMPSVREVPEAADAMEGLFMTVTSSFTFLPAPTD